MPLYAVRKLDLGKCGVILAGGEIPSGWGKTALGDLARKLGHASWTDIARTDWTAQYPNGTAPAGRRGKARATSA